MRSTWRFVLPLLLLVAGAGVAADSAAATSVASTYGAGVEVSASDSKVNSYIEVRDVAQGDIPHTYFLKQAGASVPAFAGLMREFQTLSEGVSDVDPRIAVSKRMIAAAATALATVIYIMYASTTNTESKPSYDIAVIERYGAKLTPSGMCDYALDENGVPIYNQVLCSVVDAGWQSRIPEKPYPWLIVNGSDHDDQIVIDLSTDRRLFKYMNVNGQLGNDTIQGSGHPEELFGEIGNDTIHGGGGDDWLLGFGGHSALKDGVDEPVGFRSGSDNDRLFGEDGRDIINGGPGRDVVSGGPGDDNRTTELEGLADGKIPAKVSIGLYGGAGDDVVNGGTGKDLMEGGSGRDTILAKEADIPLVSGIGSRPEETDLVVSCGPNYRDNTTDSSTGLEMYRKSPLDPLDSSCKQELPGRVHWTYLRDWNPALNVFPWYIWKPGDPWKWAS